MEKLKRRSKKSLYASERHKILREVYRHYFDFRDYVGRTGQDIIEYAVESEEGSGTYVPMNISFSDLKDGINELAPRKREAFFFNVILDWRQKDVAAHMGITTVSVGQYVDAAMMQLAKRYFAEHDLLESVHDQERNRQDGTVV
jgi:DNA-directed RNA polymerase specialized sigma24 family protein